MLSSLFLSTSLMLLVIVPFVVLEDPEWCAFGVDESKAAPEVFAGVADFSYQLKCMTPCKNIINLPSVGSRNLHLQMAFRSKSSGDTHKALFNGAQRCVYKQQQVDKKFELSGACPGQSGKGHQVDSGEWFQPVQMPDPKLNTEQELKQANPKHFL